MMPAVAAAVAQIPQDVSWAAFVKLCNLVDVSQAMRALDLLRVKKVKMVAIKPYLQKVSDDVNLAGLESTDLPFLEFIVGNKLVAWVKQFTTVEVTKQQKSIQKPLVSKSLSPTSLSPVAQKTPLPLQQQPPPVAAGPKDDSKQQQQQQQGAQGRYKVKGMENIVSKGKSKAKASADGDKRVVALTHLPATRNKIPKVDLQIVPFYSEVVDNIHANPVMIALLSTNPVKPNLDRLSIKVYDIITSVECIVNVNMREYTLFQKELDQQLHDEACQFFEPTDPQWWVRNVSKILIVQGRVHNKLYVIISKKSIESLVVEAIKDREAQESAGPGPIELQESSPSSVYIRPRDGSVRSDNYEEPFDADSIQSDIGNATLVIADAPGDMDMKRASSEGDKGLLCRSSTSAVDTAADEPELNAAALVPSNSAVEDREQGPKQLTSTYIAEDHEMLTDPCLASAAADDEDEEDDDLYGHDFVTDEITDEPLPVNCTPVVEDVRGDTDELVGVGPTPVFAREDEEEEEEEAQVATAAMIHSLGIEQQQQPPEEHTTSSQQLYSDTLDCDPDIEDSPREEYYEDITSSVMLEAMGSLLNNEASGSSSHNGSGSGSGFEESSSYDLDLEKMILRTKDKDKDKGVTAEQKQEKEEEQKNAAQQEDEEEGEDPAVDHVAATEEEDEEENGYDDDDDDDAASNYDSDDFDNITIKNESPGDKYEPASNYAGIEYDHHSMDSDNQYADPVCDDEEEEEHRPPPHNNNQHESDEYDRNRERSDDDDYDFDDDLDNDRRYGDDEDDDFDIHSGQDDDDAYALRVVQNVLAEEYGEEFYDRDGYEGHNNNNNNNNNDDGYLNHHDQDDFDGSIIAQPNNYDQLSYGDDYDSSNAYPNNQLSNADDFDTNIAQPHNQLSYAEDFDSSIAQPNDETHYTDEFDSSTLQLQHNDRSSYASDDFDNLSSKSKEGLDKGLEDDVSGAVAAGGRHRRYQDEEEGVYVASSSDGEADNLKADNISTDGEVGMDDVGMGLSSEGEEDAVPGQLRPGDGLSALERVQKEFEEGGEDDDDTEYLIDFD